MGVASATPTTPPFCDPTVSSPVWYVHILFVDDMPDTWFCGMSYVLTGDVEHIGSMPAIVKGTYVQSGSMVGIDVYVSRSAYTGHHGPYAYGNPHSTMFEISGTIVQKRGRCFHHRASEMHDDVIPIRFGIRCSLLRRRRAVRSGGSVRVR